jgi:integrase
VVDITVKFLQDFSTWIPKNPIPKNRTKKITMSRAPSHYLGSIRTMHNEMKLQYNDEENGLIPIPGSPFTRFKVPKPPVTEKRAISATAIKKIYDLKDKKETRGSGSCRYNLAKDCFMISFFLMGMNSADLYDCTDLKGNTLRYFRKKTRGRREDKAEIVITVCPELLPILQKYRDKTKVRVFDFYQRYRDESTFNAAINKGLKSIIKGLEFYSARHSWATIALNEAGVDKYTVHSALNHVEEAMKMTEVYLIKDWSLINNANRKVIDYVLKPAKLSVKRVKASL